MIFVDLNLDVFIFDHLPAIVIPYDESLSDESQISFASLYEQYTSNKSLYKALSNVCQHTLFAWVQSSICFVGVLDSSSFEVERAVATLYMSKRADTRSCQRQKFCPENTLIFDTFRNGFAKTVWVPKMFLLSRVKLLLLSAISP